VDILLGYSTVVYLRHHLRLPLVSRDGESTTASQAALCLETLIRIIILHRRLYEGWATEIKRVCHPVVLLIDLWASDKISITLMKIRARARPENCWVSHCTLHWKGISKRRPSYVFLILRWSLIVGLAQARMKRQQIKSWHGSRALNFWYLWQYIRS